MALICLNFTHLFSLSLYIHILTSSNSDSNEVIAVKNVVTPSKILNCVDQGLVKTNTINEKLDLGNVCFL